MAAKVSYLFQSSTGWYEYRRKVPKRLAKYFPEGKQNEWKKALDTKDTTTAHHKWVLENTKFEKALALAEKLRNQPNELLSPDIIEVANRIVIEAGLHPDQAPTLKPNYTKQDYETFVRNSNDWNDNFNVLLDALDEESTDYEQMQRDYKSGEWGKPDYIIPRKELPRSPLSVAYDIATGERQTSLKPSWRDAVELYIRTNKSDKNREAVKEARWEHSSRRLMERFALEFGGMEIELEKLDRLKIRDWLYTNFKAGTRNRYNNQFSAVINTWNKEHKEKLYNPFSGLSNKKLEYEEANDRRSLKPNEWFRYHEKVLQVDDIELKIITLIMLYTGCRTSEAAGLQVRDIKLNGNMPHVVFQANKIRRMDKDGLERAVPLLTPVLEALRGYTLPKDKNSAAFPKYGHTKGFDNVSLKQRQILRQGAEIHAIDVTPYSSRHTFKDRGIAASIREDEREYLMGHKGPGSSALHNRYGTKTPPELMFDHMVKIFETSDWGYYEDEQ